MIEDAEGMATLAAALEHAAGQLDVLLASSVFGELLAVCPDGSRYYSLCADGWRVTSVVGGDGTLRLCSWSGCAAEGQWPAAEAAWRRDVAWVRSQREWPSVPNMPGFPGHRRG